MKTVEIKVYRFDELSDEAKEKAKQDHADNTVARILPFVCSTRFWQRKTSERTLKKS